MRNARIVRVYFFACLFVILIICSRETNRLLFALTEYGITFCDKSFVCRIRYDDICQKWPLHFQTKSTNHTAFNQFAFVCSAERTRSIIKHLKFLCDKSEIMLINGEHASTILKRIFNCKDPSQQIELIAGMDGQR